LAESVNYVKLAKLKGEFVWHHHEQEDEMFLVVRGTLRMGVRENRRRTKKFTW
jgi:mannose-6-phosphate isomerase-like protein (cupin superfamily)